MAKYTLLEMTQLILSSMDSDEVNSINDTVEAQQVANIVRTSYDDLMARLDLPEKFDLFQLDPSGSGSLPTLMYRPNNVDNILWIRYNREISTDTVTNYTDIKYKSPQNFLDWVNTYRNADSGDRVTYTLNGITFYALNTVGPTYYSCFNDSTIVFDSYDADVDTTLQSTKTLCYGKLNTSFTMDDTFVPALDQDKFSLLLNEAKAMAFAEIKQTQHVRAEKKVRGGMIKAQVDQSAVPARPSFYATLPNYGRK